MINGLIFRFQIPRPFAMLITSLQLLQMVVGCSINYMAYGYKESGQSTNARIGVIMLMLVNIMLVRIRVIGVMIMTMMMMILIKMMTSAMIMIPFSKAESVE